jgi:hypothetical protein
VALLLPVAARAQTDSAPPSGYGYYLALLQTPISGVTPLMTYSMLGVAQRTVQFAARYGYIWDYTQPLAGPGPHDPRSLNSWAGSVVLPVNLDGNVLLTAGVVQTHCDSCSATFSAGAAGMWRFMGLGTRNDTLTMITISGQAEIGFGTPRTGDVWGFLLGAPLTVNVGKLGGTQVVSFFTPSFALATGKGITSPNDWSSGGRAIISVGAGVFNPASNIMANFGVQYVFVHANDVLIGVSLSYGGR